MSKNKFRKFVEIQNCGTFCSSHEKKSCFEACGGQSEKEKSSSSEKKFFVSFYFVGGDSKTSSSKVQLSESA